jgi:serine/threonine protein phosphatase 1
MMLYAYINAPIRGRRFVVADIHGCSQTFKHLVEHKIHLQTNDQLFLLGDYINRGPDSIGVLDYILELQDSDYQVFPLRGNHEQMLLESKSHQNPLEIFLPSTGTIALRKLNKQLEEKHWKFFENLPYFYALDKFYLVHGGFNFKIENPLNDYHAMLWIREMKPNIHWLAGKSVIYGHTRTALTQIRASTALRRPLIPLDNGCYTGVNQTDFTRFGNLCALNLDTLELLVQANVD